MFALFLFIYRNNGHLNFNTQGRLHHQPTKDQLRGYLVKRLFPIEAPNVPSAYCHLSLHVCAMLSVEILPTGDTIEEVYLRVVFISRAIIPQVTAF